MSYAEKEASVDYGSPVTLFEFIYGQTAGDAFRYSTTAEAVTLAGRSWQPHGLRHSEIVSSGSLDRAELTISARSDIEVAKLFLAAPPSQPVVVNIWRGHALTNVEGWDDFIRIWTGRVLDPRWLESEVEFRCEPVGTSAKRIGLRRYYQYGCSHMLYGRACSVSELANTSAMKVMTVANSREMIIQLLDPPAGVTPDSLTGGVLKLQMPNGLQVLRAVTLAALVPTGVRVRLMSAVPGLAPGMTGTVSRGCAHTFAACKTFGNTSNYGGCPNIPTRDAFRTNTF